LKPSLCTIVNMLVLIKCTPTTCIECGCGTSCPVDEYCMGCTSSCLSNTLAFPGGLGYFIHLFKTRVEAYIKNMLSPSVETGTPKKVLVCMIYYPDETADGSWADTTLSALGYNKNPAKLQLLIRKIFTLATERIEIPWVVVEAVPLFVPLDGKKTDLYSQRVEPSAIGGKELSAFISRAIHGDKVNACSSNVGDGVVGGDSSSRSGGLDEGCGCSDIPTATDDTPDQETSKLSTLATPQMMHR